MTDAQDPRAQTSPEPVAPLSRELRAFAAALTNRYSIEREIGRGGMATVYLARDVRHDRKVALKVLNPELGAVLGTERFLAEIKVTANLQHPNLLPLFDSGEAAGLLFYVMPFVEGETLRARLERERQLPVEEAVRIAIAVAGALDHAHRRGVVHRDLKPENILFADGQPLVADFGIALAVSNAGGQRVTQTGLSLGTPQYMSPEQATGDRVIDARTDIYSLGAVLYELLTGDPPHSGTTAQAIIAKLLTEKPRAVRLARETVPPQINAAVERALAKLPADRFTSAREFADALLAGAASTTGARASRPIRRRILVGGGAAVVALAAVVWLAARASALRMPAGATADAINSIAVLPFENVGGDTANSYFADGVTDELASALSKLPGLRVAGRTSAFAFKEKQADVREVGQRLDVGAVVTGSVRRAGSRVRVVTQLVSASNGIALWSDTYEHDVADVFAVQDSITDAIVDALRLRLSDATRGAARSGRTTSAKAHDLYLRGLAQLNTTSTREGHEKALEYFESALAEDSTYARAHAGVAAVYGFLADVYLPPVDGHGRAKAAALRAVQADSLVAEGHTLLGFAHAAYDWDFAAAERELRRGVQLDPNSATARLLYGHILCGMGRRADGLAEMQHAFRLDPLSATASWFIEQCLYLDRQYDRVISQHRRTLELVPDFFYFDDYAGASYRETGNYERALATYREAKRRSRGQPLPGLATLYARQGRVDDARRELAEIEAEARRRYLPPTPIAMVYANLGDREKMLEWIERALEVRDPILWYNRSAPEWDRWRSDPQFRRVMERFERQR